VDVYDKIVEMFWVDHAARAGKDAPDPDQSQLLRRFLEWLEVRRTGGMLIDLRLVKYGAARVTVDRAMGVADEE
jgi:hypothetical protein